MTLPNSGPSVALTTISGGASAPVIDDFSLSSTPQVLAKGTEGASYGYTFNYKSLSGNTMVIRALTYSNLSTMLTFYTFIESAFTNSTIKFSGLMANTTGGGMVVAYNGVVQRSMFSISSYQGNVLVTVALVVPNQNASSSQSYAVSVLLGALNSTLSELGSPT